MNLKKLSPKLVAAILLGIIVLVSMQKPIKEGLATNPLEIEKGTVIPAINNNGYAADGILPAAGLGGCISATKAPILFTTAFSVPPKVMVSVSCGQCDKGFAVAAVAGQITTTGFFVWFTNMYEEVPAGTLEITWIAFAG